MKTLKLRTINFGTFQEETYPPSGDKEMTQETKSLKSITFLIPQDEHLYRKTREEIDKMNEEEIDNWNMYRQKNGIEILPNHSPAVFCIPSKTEIELRYTRNGDSTFKPINIRDKEALTTLKPEKIIDTGDKKALVFVISSADETSVFINSINL